jgi:hypothetical protein
VPYGKLVYRQDLQRNVIPPSAAGMISRLACTRAREAGIDVAPLMEKPMLRVGRLKMMMFGSQ